MPGGLAFEPRLDLGIRSLLPEWARMGKPAGLREDLLAGLAVACISVPLSLAIALASGVPPAAGLVAAIVGSIAAALAGGTPLAVSGPAAAMAVLVAATVQAFGLGGLLLVGFGCGLLQLATGILGYGRLARFVPLPVVAGFTAGIGAIIFIGQLPRVLGLPPPDQAHVVEVVKHLGAFLGQTRPAALALAAGTLAVTLVLPRLAPRLPAPLAAVLLPSLAAALLGLDVERIGAIPDALPRPVLPGLPAGAVGPLLWTTLIVFALASLETLLSASAVDKLAKGQRHDPDQELIGQGCGNLLSALFGGIPITGVIVRSALNVQAGARTRRAAIVHGLAVLATVYLLAPWMARIPVAVLAGILLSVALRMLHPREFLALWRSSRSDAFTYLVTFAVIVGVDLVAGVQAGIVAALAIAGLRLGRTRMTLERFRAASPVVVAIDGSLTFLASARLEAVRGQLDRCQPGEDVILDLSGLDAIDASGGTQLLEILEGLDRRGVHFVLKGFSSEAMATLRALDPAGLLADHCAAGACDIMARLQDQTRGLGRDRLAYGVARFRRTLRTSYLGLFQGLAGGQSPHTLFITCCDSRINPNLMTSTDPGELFVIRTLGGLVPPFGQGGGSSDAAAIEFAVGVLGVREIVLCAHSGCGAMHALVTGEVPTQADGTPLPCLATWLAGADGIRRRLAGAASPDRAAEAALPLQMENLRGYPAVSARLADGSLCIHGWYYDIAEAELHQWDERLGRFRKVEPAAAQAV